VSFFARHLEPVDNTQNAPDPAIFPLSFVNSPWNTQSIPAGNFLAQQKNRFGSCAFLVIDHRFLFYGAPLPQGGLLKGRIDRPAPPAPLIG